MRAARESAAACPVTRPKRLAIVAAGMTLIATAALASGCATRPPPAQAVPEAPAATAEYRASADPAPPTLADSADALLDGLSRLCGQAFAGEIEVDSPTPAASPFAGKPLLMHVRECGHDADGRRSVRVPFHVGDDRSRTWVFTRIPAGLRLKHDHRHADGAPDAITLYGGDVTVAGVDAASRLRMEFPVDAESVAMFRTGGLGASLRNTWAVELSEQRFVYELSRPDGRLFRVVFDLTRPVPAPPPPWGG